jgi:hypothetical protein
MQTLPKPRLRRLNIRLSQQEWDKVKSLSSNTTCRNVSEYARLLLLDKPVRVFDRSRSFDDFEQLMGRLLGELEDFGEKFGSLLSDPEAKLMGELPAPETNPILPLLLSVHESYARKKEEIKEAIIKIADQCELRSVVVKE